MYLKRSIVPYWLLAFLLPLFLWSLTPTVASAQNAGVRISPAVFEPSGTFDPGSTYDQEVTVTNLNNTEETYFLFTRNISGTRPGGVPVFARDNEPTGYELADWIELERTEVTIPSGESVTVPLTITIPENASPGSHLGSIFVSVEPPEIERSGAAVGYQVANLLSLRVTGDVDIDASIREFSTDKFVYGAQNVNFTARIENAGNIVVKPIGPLEIYNMLGNKVGDVVFNEDQARVIPGEVREFQDINWTGDSLGFGRYEAIISPTYGEAGVVKTMSSTVTFWIIPFQIIGPVLGALAVLLLATFFGVRMYIRRSLEAHLSGGRRVLRRRRKKSSSATLLLIVVMLGVTALFLIVLLALFA